MRMSDPGTPEISLVLCTHNPKPFMLERCLGSVAAQTLDPERFELIVIDNCSTPPLTVEPLEAWARRPVRLVREDRPGLAFARVAGFEAARSDVIAFIDDDNEFFPDYLDHVTRLAQIHTDVGVFGGQCLGAFERPVTGARRAFLPFLGIREPGNEPLKGSGEEWGPHEPIGAGIVVRRPVATAYSRFLNLDAGGGSLGRTGKQLLAGEDSLLSRLAHRCGLLCAYFPELKLNHHIESRRFEWSYLFRLMRGHGTSYVRLSRICGKTFAPVSPREARTAMVKNFGYRLKTKGLLEAAMHVPWDMGYFDAVNETTAVAKIADVVIEGTAQSHS